jgi:hypothetical protein
VPHLTREQSQSESGECANLAVGLNLDLVLAYQKPQIPNQHTKASDKG